MEDALDGVASLEEEEGVIVRRVAARLASEALAECNREDVAKNESLPVQRRVRLMMVVGPSSACGKQSARVCRPME